MNAGSLTIWLPLAVHIQDGLLCTSWLVGGFLMATLLAVAASYRIRDEEIPRVALLSAAFFVATLMHISVGPTSVHLLLGGLVGIVLGRRAPLAILIGIVLQAALFGHGGFTTIGVNASVQMIPALLAAGLFAALCRIPPARRRDSTALWIIGCLIGMISVLATLALNALVLFWGGEANWSLVVMVQFYCHLPIVLIEGIVLGFTVAFLVRVKPEMLFPAIGDRSASIHPPALLPALLAPLLCASPAHAHRLDAGYEVLPNRQVRVEGWFDLGGVPKGATVEVFRPGQRLLVQGALDENGRYTFHFEHAEALDVIVSAGDGHKKTFTIPQADLENAEPSFHVVDETASRRERLKEALIGISFLLSLAAFIMSWRVSRGIARERKQRQTAKGDRQYGQIHSQDDAKTTPHPQQATSSPQALKEGLENRLIH
jgi:cobalt/nickel transport system permease protein